MALQLNFEICQSSNCKTLTFVETTGAYSASNTTGWGDPNPLIADMTSAVLTITLANGNSYNIDLFASGFPTDTNTEFVINNTDIGYVSSDPIDDQIIMFTYTVSDGVDTYTQNIQQAFYCQVQCCVLSMFTDIDIDCDCSKDKIDNALKSYALLKGLIYNAGCGNSTYFNNLLTQLQKLCLNSNCQNCK